MRFVSFLAAGIAALSAVPAPAAAGEVMPAASTAEAGYPAAVARMVASIIEYTRWPAATGPQITVCTAGASTYAGRIDGLRLSDGRLLVRRAVAPADLVTAGCEVAYLGAMGDQALRQAVTSTRGRSVLTIAEADPDGSGEAMFSLQFRPAALSFRLNIDAVSRSGVRIDPRVLRLSQGGR